MRISDWSSDVCSSDLAGDAEHRAEDVDDRRAGAQRLARRPGHVRQPGLERHNLDERWPALVRPCETDLTPPVDLPGGTLAQLPPGTADNTPGAEAVIHMT